MYKGHIGRRFGEVLWPSVRNRLNGKGLSVETSLSVFTSPIVTIGLGGRIRDSDLWKTLRQGEGPAMQAGYFSEKRSSQECLQMIAYSSWMNHYEVLESAPWE
jgi:hypothetical protein